MRTLGTLTVTAPSQLETFATVSGDANPIHRSDLLARFVGLPGRIVHGMWTSAAATRAVLESATEGDSESPAATGPIDFVAPVLPGQDVTFTVTRTGVRDGARVVSVEATTADGVVAMGTAVVAGAAHHVRLPRPGHPDPGHGHGRLRPLGRRPGHRGTAPTRSRASGWASRSSRSSGTTRASIEAVGTTYRHPAGVLHLTQFTQVAMATLASAQVAEMREAGVFDPEAAVAGHSVGEYNALARVIGGAAPRGRRSSSCSPAARGCTAWSRVTPTGNSDYRLAVIRPHLARLSHAQAEELVAAVAADTGELCEIVNHNLRGKQYAVAGTVRALAELDRPARRRAAGPPAAAARAGHRRAVPLLGAASAASTTSAGTCWTSCPTHIDTDALVGPLRPQPVPGLFRLDREYVQGVVRRLRLAGPHRACWPTGSARALTATTWPARC